MWLLQNESWISSEVISDEKEKWDKTPEKMRWGKLTRRKTQRKAREEMRKRDISKNEKKRKVKECRLKVSLTLQTLLSHSLGLKLPKIFVLGATKNIYHSSSARDICNTSKTRDMYHLPWAKKYVCLWNLSQTTKTNSDQLFSIFIPLGRFSSS